MHPILSGVFMSSTSSASIISPVNLCLSLIVLDTDIISSAGIARKQSQYRDLFDSPEVYYKFHSWIIRAAKYPFPQTADKVQDAIVAYLTAHKETRAAKWFLEDITSDEGQWMLVHSNVGSSANNMGNDYASVEGSLPVTAVC